MDLPRISLTLLIGPVIPVPAPQYVAEALEQVSVTHRDDGPCGFQLEFKADRTSAFQRDFPLLLGPVVLPGIRVVVIVNLGAVAHVLSDGFITHVGLSHSKAAGASTLSVTGEDVGMRMNLTEESTEHPGLGDFAIVAKLLAKYAVYGVIPMVIPTSSSLATNPLENVPQQNQTDRDYINYLAAKHGNIFRIRPGPEPRSSIAYWGPPPRVGTPLPALSVDMGPSTNVESISFSYDGLAPTLFQGYDQDAETERDIPIDTETSTRMPPLARAPALVVDRPLAKTKIVKAPGQTAGEAIARKQGATDRSTDSVVTAEGDVDTLRYGSIMTVPGLVGLRGCGLSFDGFYYVNSVTHTLRRGDYRQHFTLAREGLLSTTSVVRP
jgi:hypothetical protein